MIPHSKPFIGPEEIAAVTRVLQSGMLAQGTEVQAFEEECAALLGRRHGVALSSGTAALHLTLLCAGLGPGKQVAIPAYACSALLQAVNHSGATPQLCDCDDTYNMDAAAVAPGADAAIVAHLFGRPAELPRAPFIIEDLAQSIGGTTGRAGHAAILSFYATKMFTTGEGGMVLTDDAALAEEIRDRRDYDNRDDLKPRFACKMTDFQAALGRVQLGRLPEFVALRRENAAAFNAAFAGLPLVLPHHEDHIYFRYVIASPERDRLAAHLAAAGIEAKRPVHRPLSHFTLDTCPKAEKAHGACLSLPVYPALGSNNLDAVIQSVLKFFED